MKMARSHGVNILQTNGHLVLLGVPPSPHSFAAGSLLFKRYSFCRCRHLKSAYLPYCGAFN